MSSNTKSLPSVGCGAFTSCLGCAGAGVGFASLVGALGAGAARGFIDDETGVGSYPVQSLITAISSGSSTSGEVLKRLMAVSMASICSTSCVSCLWFPRELYIFSRRKFRKSCPNARKSPPHWLMSFSTANASSGFLFSRAL